MPAEHPPIYLVGSVMTPRPVAGRSLWAVSPNLRHTGAMLVPIVTMTVAQFFDFGTFVFMVRRHGLVAEANPLVADIVAAWGLVGIVVAKVALVVLVATTAIILARDGRTSGRRRMGAAVLTLGIVAGLVGGLTNALTAGPV